MSSLYTTTAMANIQAKKVFIITGCTYGLGLHLANAVLKAGHHLVATSPRPEQDTEDVSNIRTLGGTWARLDVTSPEMEGQFNTAVGAYNRVDMLITNLAGALGGCLEELPVNELASLFSTNFFGPLRLIKLTVQRMLTQGGGSIVNIYSPSKWLAVPGNSAHAAESGSVESEPSISTNEVVPLKVKVFSFVPAPSGTSNVKVDTLTTPMRIASKQDNDNNSNASPGGGEEGAQQRAAHPSQVAKVIVNYILGHDINEIKGPEASTERSWIEIPMRLESAPGMRMLATKLMEELTSEPGSNTRNQN